jgi:phage-related protein
VTAKPQPGSKNPPPDTGGGGGFNWTSLLFEASPVAAAKTVVEAAVASGVTQVESVAGFADYWAKKLAKPIFDAIEAAIHTVISFVVRVVGLVHHAVVWLSGLAHHVLDLANAALDWIHHAVTWVVGEISHAITLFYNDIIQPALNVIKSAASALDHFAHTEVAKLTAGLKALADQIAAGIKAVAGPVVSFVHTAINDALSVFHKDLIDPILHDVNVLKNDVASITLGLGPDVITLLEELLKMPEWILWFAEHSITDIEALISGDFLHVTRADFAAGLASGQRTIDPLEKWLEDLFK